MADTADLATSIEFLRTRSEQVSRAIFDGAEGGNDLPQPIRDVLARIHNLDDRDDRFRWSIDSLNSELRSDPSDIDETDIENLSRITQEFFAEAESDSELETIAHLYLLSLGGESLVIPDGQTALDQLQVVLLKQRFADASFTLNENGNSVIPDELQYNIAQEDLLNPISDDFITAFGGLLAQIQNDMQQIGLAGLPNATDGSFLTSEQILSDDHRDAAITVFIETLGDNDQINEIRALEDQERFDALTAYINGLDDSNPDKTGYLEVLEGLNVNADALARLTILHEFDVLDQSPEGQINQRNFIQLQDIAQVGLDGSGMIGSEMERLLPAYLDYISRTTGDIGDRAEIMRQFFAVFNEMPEDIRTDILSALEENAGPAPGVQLPPTPEEIAAEEAAAEQARREAETPVEQLLRISVLESVAETMGIPNDIVSGIEDHRVLSGIAYAHFDEGFERQMREIMSENFVDIYGLHAPTSDSPSDRIGGDPDLWIQWQPGPNLAENVDAFFAIHSENPTIQEIADQTDDPVERFELLRTALENISTSVPLRRGFDELYKDVRTNTFEYHIQPDTGNIEMYRIGADGDLYQTVSSTDNTPLVLEGQFPDFDIFHPNDVTRDFLDTLVQRQWAEHYQEHAAYYESLGVDVNAPPSVADMDSALTNLEQRVTQAIRALHQDMSDEDLERLSNDILNNDYTLDQLRERLRAENGSDDVVLQINSYMVLINQIEDLRDITSLRDYTNYATLGLLPNGSSVDPLQMRQPWGQGLEQLYNENNGFAWERATEGRILEPSVYSAYNNAINNGGSVSAELFQDDNYAMAYIRDRGWLDENGEGQLSYIQTSMVTRELMIKEAADRHGITPPDGANPEAIAAFVEDYRNGHYNLHDIEIMMRSFDADGEGRAEMRAEHASVAYRTTDFDDPADTRHRNQAFHEMFAQPTELERADGTSITVESTISVEDATLMFWRDYRYREDFGYDDSLYAIGYDEMVARHGDDFTNAIAEIMENNTIYNMNMLRDVNNPLGDFYAREVRRYQANYVQNEELEYKAQHNIITLPEPSASEPRLNAEYDTITPMPELAVEEEEASLNETPPTPEDIAANGNDMTVPSAEVVAIMGGGTEPVTTPTLDPLSRPI